MTGRGFGKDEHPEELLSASVSGDLSTAERAALDTHLAGCARCRATLEAFREERHLLSGLREVPAPRDLGARVRAGIEGRAAAPWWRRPSTLVAGVASLATVAAALLAVVVLSGIPRGEVGNATPSPSASVGATPSPVPSEEQPTPEPSQRPVVALAPGELGYLGAVGGGMSELRLSFRNVNAGLSQDLGTVPGPPVAASISPGGEFLAYITEVGESGAYRVAVARLSDGMTELLGCGAAVQFADRLAWSDDGRFLAYTLAAVDLGDSIECGAVAAGDGSGTDAYVYDAGATGEAFRLTETGNAFAADFLRSPTLDGEYKLLVSYAAAQPYSEPISVLTGQSVESERVNAFMPLISPDGQHAMFWRGVMAPNEGGGWRLEQGGMPYVSGEPVDGQPSWSGEPLFADLTLVGGAGFQAGEFAWAGDSDRLAFWGGEWTGAPQSDDGTYPSSEHIYLGRLSSGLITQASAVAIETGFDHRVIGVAFDLNAGQAVVTAALPRAGVGDGPSSYLVEVPLGGGEPQVISGAADPQPWYGPAVVGYEAVIATP
jgi:hypothetical protein